MSVYHDYSQPKNGKKFKVIGVVRISTEHQDEKSLEDQEHSYRSYLDAELGVGNYDLTINSSRGSGQILDRSEFLRLCEMVESGQYDVVVAEDLSRISRRIQVIGFCEEAEDSNTRVIAINDHVDTAQDNWMQASFFASFKNQAFCKDTSERIKRTHRSRFLNGEIFQCEIYGYVKPRPKANDSEVYKDPAAEAIYDEWFTRLESGQNYREIADWLNDAGVKPGKYCRSNKWNGRMVSRVTFNPILKGERVRNKRVAVRINRTGRSRTLKAPPGHEISRIVPTLAFIEAERYDRVIRLLKKRNAKYRRSESERNDPRSGIPRRHTRFPGQNLRCGVCGRLFVFGGHGDRDRLMCNGARDHVCWNSMSVYGPDVARAVADQIRNFIQNMEGFDAQWLASYEEQRQQFSKEKNGLVNSLEKELASVQRKLSNQLGALEIVGASDSIIARIKELDAVVLDLKDRISSAKKSLSARTDLPSLAEIRAVAAEVFRDMAIDSVEFSNAMRRMVTDFFVLPYRLVDGGRVQPRLTYRASLASLLPDSSVDLPVFQFEGIVDLIKSPVRAAIRKDVVDLVNTGMKHADIAEKLGVFKTEVGTAMSLHRRMLEKGLDDPWIPITSVEQASASFKRVRNPRFRFEPLEGFETTRHRG